MVLEDVGDAPRDSFGDSSYPSDNDPYSSSTTTGRRFDASQLPQPIPILGPFLGFSQRAIRFKTEQTLQFAEKRVHRALTQEEAQTLAFHLYKMEQSKSYFVAVGWGYGTWRWYSTMSAIRFPFYRPKPGDIDPNKFLFIKGPAAQWARHSWRLLIWGALAGEVGRFLGYVTVQPIAARDTAADPKLEEFTKDLKSAMGADIQQGHDHAEQQRNERLRRMGKNPDGSPIHPKPHDSPGQELPPHAGAPRPWAFGRRPQDSSPAVAEDDMSPTTSNEPWPSAPSNSYGDSTFAPDSTENQKRQPVSRATPPNNPFGRKSSEPADDDMSPTGGFFQEEVQNQSKPGESAWDRLRRGGGPLPGQRPPPRRSETPNKEQREGPTLGDSFTFADSEEERKRAQERAQREFDERIERERRGKDFNDDQRWR